MTCTSVRGVSKLLDRRDLKDHRNPVRPNLFGVKFAHTSEWGGQGRLALQSGGSDLRIEERMKPLAAVGLIHGSRPSVVTLICKSARRTGCEFFPGGFCCGAIF